MYTARPAFRLLGVLFGALILSTAQPVAASEGGQFAAAQVSEDSYRHYLDDMLYTHSGDNRGFGPEHNLAQANIVDLFESFGLTVTLEPVSYYASTYYNIVGTMTGTTNPGQEYVIGAHYDSVNNPGADDNASGVALILEAARVLTAYESDLTIRFVAFDREEQGLYGSEDYAQAHVNDDILGMISTDMVAYNTGANAVEIYGRPTSDPVKNAVAQAVATYGVGLGSTIRGQLDASDHAPFEWYGFQACLLSEDWGNPNYHTQQDNVDMPDYLDYAYATRITRAVVGFLVDHAGVTVDTTECVADIDCDDGVFCNGAEICVDTHCEPGTPPVCDDDDPCNGVETCDPQSGCVAGQITDCNENGIEDVCDLAQCDNDPACGDCNNNGILDTCDGLEDINGNGTPDECETPCADNTSCDDDHPCTFDVCQQNLCWNAGALHCDLAGENGSCGPDGEIDAFDVFAVLDGFQGIYASGCERTNIDVVGANGSCTPDGVIDLLDILAVLDAFQGVDRCCSAGG